MDCPSRKALAMQRVFLHSKRVRYAIPLIVIILILSIVINLRNSSKNMNNGHEDTGIIRLSNTAAGHFLCYTYNGRLGNHMFEFASLTGIAVLNDRTLIVGKDDYLYKIFDIKNVTVLHNRDICNSFESIEEGLGCCKFDASLMTLPKDKSYNIGFYLQSWKYFYHVQDKIMQQYQFRNHIKMKAMHIVKKIRRSSSENSLTLTGIHIRIGDIANEMHNRMGLVIAPEGYIYKAMDYMKSKFPKITFVVASDDLQWSKRVLSVRLNDSIHFLENDSTPEVDLAILTSCDHVIQTVGSFGWWAGFLVRGISIYYPHPGRVGSPGEARYNYEDFFLPKWIPIDL